MQSFWRAHPPPPLPQAKKPPRLFLPFANCQRKSRRARGGLTGLDIQSQVFADIFYHAFPVTRLFPQCHLSIK